MRRKEVIRKLQADLAQLQNDMWQLSAALAYQHTENNHLQQIITRQDETILALWGLIEAAEREEKQ